VKRAVKLVGSTPFRTFFLYPVIVLAWELFPGQGHVRVEPWFLPLLAWGYLQYRLVGRYRIRRGGGGPGMETPPERLVTTGPFAWCRNPMYLGHLIFLLGLALSLRSVLAALIAVATAAWFQVRVRRDEARLHARFGETYAGYAARVRRWIPMVF
jgi:protein-S-isoprenylcysteine O-methyltransferase Ste14